MNIHVTENSQARQAFIARGLRSGEEARRAGEYVSSDEVLKSLAAMLAARHRDLDLYAEKTEADIQ